MTELITEPQRETILAHENAVFDVQWSQDDTLLVRVVYSLIHRASIKATH